MTRSLGHAVYRALSRRRPAAAPRERPPRPERELLWVHAGSASRYSAICDLGLRLEALRPGLSMLVTVEAARPEASLAPRQGCFWIEGLTADGSEAAREFLAHWRPDICLWTGGELMPTLILETAAAGIPMVLIDVDQSEWQSPLHKWFPTLLRESLECFEPIMVNGTAESRLVQRAGIPKARISVTGQLGNSVTPPGCSERLLGRTVRDINARPVWLAAHAQAAEYDDILAAHASALRLLHRLLLVITVANPDETDQLRALLDTSGLRWIDWAAGAAIEDATQVVLSGDGGDLGLWYRIAPLTFMASSLVPTTGARNPLEPAALGSAILSGPHARTHVEAYARLAAAGATRTIQGSDELAASVVQLSAPDKAAAMAHAGWEVVTESAPLTDRLIDLMQDLLDRREATRAGA